MYNFSAVEQLYFDLTERETYEANSDRQTTFSKQLQEEADAYLDTLEKAIKNPASDFMCSMHTAGEVDGFVLGFSYAMNLMNECKGVFANAGNH